MGFLSRIREGRARRGESEAHVSEEGGVRTLHLGSDTVQSSMRLSDPNELVLSYTRAMMGFLLFHREPRHLVMIGLGGGSLAKFAYHRFPEAMVTAIECNPKVIALARTLFHVPPDDERFVVLQADGDQYVRDNPASCDVLMVDAFDHVAQVEALATEDFYARARDALVDDGVLVVNLWSTDNRFDTYLQRIERVFDHRVVCLPAERKGNVAVFAFTRRPTMTRFEQLKERARELEARTGLEFLKFVGRLSELNPHTEHRLLV